MSNYRCRLHPDFAVTWRGTGCVVCAVEARKRAKKPTPDWALNPTDPKDAA